MSGVRPCIWTFVQTAWLTKLIHRVYECSIHILQTLLDKVKLLKQLSVQSIAFLKSINSTHVGGMTCRSEVKLHRGLLPPYM